MGGCSRMGGSVVAENNQGDYSQDKAYCRIQRSRYGAGRRNGEEKAELGECFVVI